MNIYIKNWFNVLAIIFFHITPNILNEEVIDVVIEEKVNKKDFQKSDTEIETCESIDELKFSQEYKDGVLFYWRV